LFWGAAGQPPVFIVGENFGEQKICPPPPLENFKSLESQENFFPKVCQKLLFFPFRALGAIKYPGGDILSKTAPDEETKII
jgi:hypothetical protein